MVRYFYAWTPLVIVTTIVLLSLPWLGMFALMAVALVALAALAALAWVVVLVPYKLIRAIGRSRQGRSAASPRPTPALSPATRQRSLQNGYVS